MPLDLDVPIDDSGNAGPCAIHRLNDDCLAAIFYDAVLHLWPTMITKADCLLRITHVCRRWRELALHLAELWAEVVFARPQTFFAYLERARESPLSLTFNYHRDMERPEAPYRESELSKEQMLYLMLHPERIRVLHIQDQEAPFALAFAGQTLPVVESIHFDYTGDEPHFNCDATPLYAPMLERATFWNLYVPLLAPRLTSFALHTESNETAVLDIKSLLALLSTTPLLESLNLDHCLPENGWEIDLDARFELPCIVKLRVTGSVRAIASVIGMFTYINDHAYVDLNVESFDEEGEVSTLTGALLPYLRRSTSHDMLSLNGYSYFSGTEPSLRMWSSSKTDPLRNSYTLSIDVAEGPVEDIACFYKRIFEGIPESQMQHLNLYREDMQGTFDWRQTIPAFHMPQLTRSIQSILYKLDYDPRGDMSEVSDFSSELLPMFLLVKPTLYASVHTFTLEGDAYGYREATTPNEAQKFICWLRVRVAGNVPLQTIRLTGDVFDTGTTNVQRPRDWMVWRDVAKLVQVVDERSLRPTPAVLPRIHREFLIEEGRTQKFDISVFSRWLSRSL